MDTIKLTGNLVKIPNNGETITIDDTYNGWTNKETWLVNVWLNNDYDLYKYYLGRLNDSYGGFISDIIHELQEIVYDIVREDRPETNGLAYDLLQSSLNVINYKELAEHYIDDIKETQGKE
jgi:hypothetical protein